MMIAVGVRCGLWPLLGDKAVAQRYTMPWVMERCEPYKKEPVAQLRRFYEQKVQSPISAAVAFLPHVDI